MQRPQYVSDAIETTDAGLHVGTYGPFRLQSGYQPIYEIDNGVLTLFGYEGLVRPFQGGEAVSPINFFAQVDAGDRLFAECMCRALHLRNYPRADPGGGKLFINLNPAIYESVEVVEREFRFMFSILALYGLTPGHLVCEVLETEALDDMTLRRLCAMLREAGCSIAIDDFGTGKSGMARYRDLSPDLVKLDGGMFRSMAADQGQLRLLRKMVGTFVDDGVMVLVEGIETDAHLLLAQELGASYFQGYGLARPQVLPASFSARLALPNPAQTASAPVASSVKSVARC